MTTDTDTLRDALERIVEECNNARTDSSRHVALHAIRSDAQAALATLSKPEPAAEGEHWSRQQIINRIVRAMTEAAKGHIAVPAGKAADDILELLRPALYVSPVPSGGADTEALAGYRAALQSGAGK